MPKKSFTAEELSIAISKVARGEVPSWMNSFEKQAYALGVIGEEHIMNCPRCNGRGWLVSCNPYADAACVCPGSTGRIITDEGKALVKAAFPEYKMHLHE